MPRVLVTFDATEAALACFEHHDIHYQRALVQSEQELLKKIGPYDGLLLRKWELLSARVVEKATKLRVIGCLGGKPDEASLTYINQAGILVLNASNERAVAVAEHTLTMMLCLSRRILPVHKHVQKHVQTHLGGPPQRREPSREVLHGLTVLDKKCLGLVGLGTVGKLVAAKAQSLGMRVCVCDPYVGQDVLQGWAAVEDSVEAPVEALPLEAVLRQADFVSLHVPLTSETKNMLGEQAIFAMKPGSFLINCAHRDLVDEMALCRALEQGHLAGAGLDRFDEKNLDRLMKLDSVLCTPGLSGETQDTRQDTESLVARRMTHFLLEGAIESAVNFPELSRETIQQVRPYLFLGELLGSMLAQLGPGKTTALTFEMMGAGLWKHDELIVLSGLIGYLGETKPRINRINVKQWARELGLKVTSIRGPEDPRLGKTLRITTWSRRKKQSSVTGRVSQTNQIRITALQGLGLDAALSARMLYIEHTDRPGIFGALGSALGEKRINIGGFSCGREDKVRYAVALLALDNPLQEEMVMELSQIPGILRAMYLRFSV